MNKKSKLFVALLTAATMVIGGGAFAGCNDEHTHTYSDDWEKDSTGHWHVATCDDLKKGDEGFTKDFSAHVWGDDDECDECHYQRTPAQVNVYTVTLVVGEGTLPKGTETTLTTVNGKLTALPTPTPPVDKVFSGWYTAAAGGTKVTTDTVFEANGSIYAQYSDVGETAPVVTVTNGETPITLVAVPVASPDTAKYKYSVEGNTLSLSEGDELTFLIDGEAPANFGGKPSNHGVEIASNVVTANDTGTFTFYLRYYEDNSWWEVEMSDGKTDTLYDGHYYLVGGISSWTCTAKYDLGDPAETSTFSITKKFAADAEFKISTYSAANDTKNEGKPYWDGLDIGSSAVTAGLGYLKTGDNIIIEKAGTYTIEFDGTNVKISSKDVEEPELDLDYSAKITFKDGVKATIQFTLPQKWNLGEDLKTGFIMIGETKISINPSGSVTFDASDIDVSEPITVYGGFKQGGATWSVHVDDVTIEDGATYKLVFGNYTSESGGIKYASCSWEKIG